MIVLSHKKPMLVCRYLLTLILLSLSFISCAEVVVIVNPSNMTTLDEDYVKNIFLGKIKKFSNGELATPVEIESGELRNSFVKEVLKRNEGSLNSHWARMIFTGKALPPRAFKTEEEIKLKVANNPNYIGFIDSSHVDGTVKVIKLN